MAGDAEGVRAGSRTRYENVESAELRWNEGLSEGCTIASDDVP